MGTKRRSVAASRGAYLPPRLANAGDIDALVRHRAEMFAETGMRRDERFETMLTNSERWFRARVADGTYLGFLIAPTDSPRRIVAGGGLLVLDWPPTHRDAGTLRGYILNVYVEPDHRRRGLARDVTEACLDTCRARGIHIVTLHASAAGRRLYERLGFAVTSEMRLVL